MEEEKSKFMFKHDTKLPVKLFLTVTIITLKNWSEKVSAPPPPPFIPYTHLPYFHPAFTIYQIFHPSKGGKKKKFTPSHLKKSGSKLWMLDWVLNKSLLTASLKLSENFTTENTEV